MTQRELISKTRALIEAGDVVGLRAMAKGKGWERVNGLAGLCYMQRQAEAQASPYDGPMTLDLG
jgi:hypothetical protein